MSAPERYSDKRMKAPFDVHVLLDGRMKFDAAAFLQEAERAFPAVFASGNYFATGTIDTDEVVSLAALMSKEGSIAISSHRGERCPEQHYELAASRAFHFPYARSVLQRHTDYVTFSTLATPPDAKPDLASRYRSARLVTCLAAVAAAQPACIGLIFPSGDVVAAPKLWREEAEKLKADAWPWFIWMSINIANGQMEKPGPIMSRCSSIGVAAFNGHEIDYFWAPVLPGDMALSIVSAAELLLGQGHVFNDGDTMGPEDGERLVLRHLTEGPKAQTDMWAILHPKCPYSEVDLFGPRPGFPPPPGVDNTIKDDPSFMKRLLGRFKTH